MEAIGSKQTIEDVKIIIVGAGYAGLAAGRRLQKELQIKDFLILEARETLGGRIFTYTTPKGNKVDLGGSWIGNTQTRMIELSKDYKQELTVQYEKGRNQLWYQDKIVYYTGLIPKIDIRLLINFTINQWKLDRLANTIDLDNPLASPDALKYDKQTFEQYLDAHFLPVPATLMKRAFELIFGVKNTQISTLHALQYIKSGLGCDSLFKGQGGAQHYKFKGGSISLINKIVADFSDKIRLNQPIEKITRDNKSEMLLVYTTNNKIYRCEKIILALPPRCINNIQMPGLISPQKKTLFEKQKAHGYVYKVLLVYESLFWRKNNLSGCVINSSGLLNMTFDGNNDENEKKGKLICFLDQDEIQKIGKENKKEITKQLMMSLEIFFGKEALNYEEILFGDFLSSSPYIQGCPTGINPPNLFSQVSEPLYTPIENKIFFAGTESSDIWQGFMEGAVRSGERAVNQILGIKTKKKSSLNFSLIILSFIIIAITIFYYRYIFQLF